MRTVNHFLVSLILLAAIPFAEASTTPRRIRSEAFDGAQIVLQENALFFSTLTGLALTLAVSDPVFGFDIDDINLNLITRHVRDSAGGQMVVCRLGGVVRSNNNVEMNVLDDKGVQVGRMFYGFNSGDLLFFDAYDQLIVRGFIDGWGGFYLTDLRLDSDKRALASGRFNWCRECPGFEFYWYDGRNELLSRGLIFFFPQGSNDTGIDSIRIRWMHQDGSFGNGQWTEIEAEYDLRRETTGAINSNFFDARTSAASFFVHPYDLAEPPPARAWLPRVTDSTWISIVNNSAREASVTLTARLFDGSLLRGTGVQNPVTFRFNPKQQYAAPPADYFQESPAGTLPPPLLPPGALPVWVEVTGDRKEISVVSFDLQAEESESVTASIEGRPLLLFDGLRSTHATQTEISILNPSYSATYISMKAYGETGEVLSGTERFFVPARGFRNFILGALPELFPGLDVTRIATLRAESLPGGPGLAAVLVRREQEALEIASERDESEGTETIWVPFFVTGGAGGEMWTTWLSITAGTSGETPLEIEGFSFEGDPVFRTVQWLRGWGSVSLSVGDLLETSGAGIARGFIRISGTAKILGRISYRLDSDAGQSAASQPLSPYPVVTRTFQEISSGTFGSEKFYSGMALLNATDYSAEIRLRALDNEGRMIAEAPLQLGPNRAMVVLLEDIFGTGFELLGGQLLLDSSSAIYCMALSGNARGTLLTTIPAVGGH